MADPIPKETINFREFLATTVWILRIYGQISRKWTIIKLVTVIIAGLQTTIYAFLFAKVLDRLVFLAQTPNSSLADIAPYLVAFFLFTIEQSVLNYVASYANRTLRIRGRTKLRIILFEKLHELGIQTLEQPQVQNRLNRAQDNIYSIPDYMDQLMTLITQLVTVVSAGAIIATSTPIFVPILFVVVLPRLFVNSHFAGKLWKFERDTTEGRRQAGWTQGTLQDTKELKEIIILGGYNYLSSRVKDFYTWFDTQIIKLRMRWTTADSILGVIADIAVYAGYVVIFARLLAHEITIGDVSFQMRALSNFSNALNAVGGYISDLQEDAIRLKDVHELLSMESMTKDGIINLPVFEEPPELEFEDVSFKYPGSEKFIFSNLNLKIEAGEKVAIVGHNGAGKTTLVKLISRIYEVNEGKIMVNGMNLNGIKLDKWYQNLGVLFQDFNMYEFLTAKENIYMGWPVGKCDDKAIIEAAKQADADDFIQDFPLKYETVLGERFKGGIRPSGGMWQKIAIARFFYRNAPLLIFDEPTAAIDAVSEYKIFNRIYKFFRKKTVIIISHRFSTVRNADRILVMEKGKIVEEGTHEHLMEINGKYAHAFKLQAQGYQH